MKNGTLYGVGVGPGDPDLITLKATKILRQVDVIFAAASTKNSYSLSMEIVSRHLKEGVPVVPLGFPMTRDKRKLASAWEKNGRKVVEPLKRGENAAFITLGDPLIYSTFGYIFHTIKETEPHIPIEIIPGITSYQAGAAVAGQILAEAEESFAVISGALGAERLKDVVGHTDQVVLLKVYHKYQEIMDTLNQLGLASGSILISRCGLDGEVILRDLKKGFDTPPPYLSLLLIKKTDRV